MKIHLTCFLIILLLVPCIGFGQTPVVEWDEAMGGTATDNLRSVYPTVDGGAILAGRSLSDSSDDKSEDSLSPGLWDFWIVKVDSNGDIEWENTIGGDSEDFPLSVVTTIDNGYIISGISSSSAGIDKTEENLGSRDLWIVKLDSNGIILWDETIGGVNQDSAKQIIPLSDGSFVIAASSYSPMSADKSEDSYGSSDVWIIKIDENGDIIWENTIGGSAEDEALAITELSSGGFVVAAQSRSPISGEKTTPNLGGSDYWLVGLSSEGEKVWDKTLGGASDDVPWSIHETQDGNIIVGGESASNSSEFKSEDAMGPYDYWLVKLTTAGDIIWENTIGGDDADIQGYTQPLINGDYLVCGWSFSGVSGDKTDASNGGADFWVVRLNPDGTINWQDSIGGDGGESYFQSEFTPSADGSVIIGGSSFSGISGDRTEPNLGLNDYWLFKLDNVLGLNDYAEESNIFLVNDLANNEVQVIGLNSDFYYQIYSLNGQMVKSGNTDADNTINVENLRSGVYFLHIKDLERRGVLKFIKR